MPSLFPAPSPELPEEFRSLLVKGKYHASAPIHLAMSVLTRNKDFTAVIVTPSRNMLLRALQEYQDDWIKTNHGRGDVSALSSRIKLFYPPSPAHLAFLMMMSGIPDAATAVNASWINNKATFSKAPSLLVLHEISSYFTQEAPESDLTSDLPSGSTPGRPQNGGWTVSSYLSLVAHSLSFLTRPGQPPNNRAFALFDSGLGELRLPILRESETEPRLEPVSTYLEKYFYWFIDVLEEDDDGRKTLLVYQNGQPLNQAERWTYREHVESVRDGLRSTTHIVWH